MPVRARQYGFILAQFTQMPSSETNCCIGKQQAAV